MRIAGQTCERKFERHEERRVKMLNTIVIFLLILFIIFGVVMVDWDDWGGGI